MKILMITRSTLYSSPGGDTIQIESTAKYLRKLGVDVDIKLTNDPSIRYEEYSLLHFFNVIRPADLLLHASRSGKPYALSPIYVDYSEFEEKSRAGALRVVSIVLSKYGVEYLKTIARAVLNGEKIISRSYLWRGQKNSMRKLILDAGMLLPNSANEMKRLETDLGISAPSEVIPNAIDQEKFGTLVRPTQPREGVICVARIEGLKNQLNLIRALNGTGIKLTIIGKISPNHQKYADRCRAEAGPNVTFINHLSQEELKGIYAAAKVHVLPSWFETTGLSSLEAGYMGCNIVVTPKGDTVEYFRDLALYCDPASVESIRDAILKAYNTDLSANLQQRIADEYVWQETAGKTYQAYQKILATINNK